MGSEGHEDWEPRSRADRIVVVIWRILDVGSRAALVIGALLASHLFAAVIGIGLIFRPAIAISTVLSVVPAAMIVAYLWLYNDEVSTPEPLRLVLLAFLVGVAFAGLPLAINTVGFNVLFRGDAATASILFLVFVTAPLEELTKLYALRFGLLDRPAFDHVLDGIVYGAATGLGFATFENGIYLTQALGDGSLAGAAVSRAAASPLHVLATGLAGYYLGLAKFNERYFGPLVMKGLLIAIVAHALYNGFLAVGVGVEPGTFYRLSPRSPTYAVSVLATLLIMAGLAFMIVAKIRKHA